MFKIRQLILMLALMSSCLAFKTDGATIKGYVYDKKTNEPIIGAIVTLVNHNKGTQTDFNGRFILQNISVGTEQIHVKSLGFSDFTQTITITDGNAEIDLENINMKKAKSKHYNRIALSYNPQLIPTLCPHEKLFYDSYGVAGVSASYLHGFNFHDHFAVELGAKYNFTFDSFENNDFHTQSKHHSVSVLANLVYNLRIKETTFSPYIGLYLRKFLYSKLSYGNDQECTVYDTELWFNKKWKNHGMQVGLGVKFNRFYLGAELSYDLYPERYLSDILFDDEIVGDIDNNLGKKFVEYSFTIGFEF